MRIVVFSIFPELIVAFAEASLLGKAQADGLLEIETIDLRDFATGVHRSVDDTPFGGGAGMVMSPEPIFAAVESVQPPRPLILLTPGGVPFTQTKAKSLATLDGFSLLCGRYEGVDQRVIDHLVDEELSIGDYVLNGGEVAAAAVIEAVGRLIPGVIGNAESLIEESHSSGLLEYPQYTRPAEFHSWEVPEVLASGHHGEISDWRHAQALYRTARVRPDLIAARGGLSADELELVRKHVDPDYTG